MKALQDFTGLYPVQKTLRFELKPQEETKKFIKLSEDFLRAEYYPKLKDVLDDYYRYYIEKVLSDIDMGEDIDLGECFDLYNAVKKEKTTQAKKAYKKATDEICKKISKLFKDNFETYSLEKDGFSKLLKNDSKLFIWLKGRLSSGNITQKEYDDSVEAIKAYIGYATCLQGFNNNRKNMFEETGATSISYRTVENMERYFDNCNNYLQITGKYPDTKTIFADTEKYFIPKNYCFFIAQSQIDGYNEVLGHAYDNVNAKGINQKLNEYAQKNGLKHRDIPMMSVLYKQILSDRQTFVIDKIEKDEDLFALVTELSHKFMSTVKL
ncbi:MAG: hypothetical protein J5903_02805 [Clostridia bacterium]|nr:hypothetical protein [Clostridia bacterium]